MYINSLVKRLISLRTKKICRVILLNFSFPKSQFDTDIWKWVGNIWFGEKYVVYVHFLVIQLCVQGNQALHRNIIYHTLFVTFRLFSLISIGKYIVIFKEKKSEQINPDHINFNKWLTKHMYIFIGLIICGD